MKISSHTDLTSRFSHTYTARCMRTLHHTTTPVNSSPSLRPPPPQPPCCRRGSLLRHIFPTTARPCVYVEVCWCRRSSFGRKHTDAVLFCVHKAFVVSLTFLTLACPSHAHTHAHTGWSSPHPLPSHTRTQLITIPALALHSHSPPAQLFVCSPTGELEKSGGTHF